MLDVLGSLLRRLAQWGGGGGQVDWDKFILLAYSNLLVPRVISLGISLSAICVVGRFGRP